jgi:hypothetical protein
VVKKQTHEHQEETRSMKTHRITTASPQSEHSHFQSARAFTRGMLTAAAALTLWAGATNPAQAALLSTSAAHLTYPGSLVSFPSVAVGLTSFSETPYTSFSLAWDGSAPLAWQGTVNGTGPYTAGPRPAGTTLFNFSALNAGFLPTGTFVGISDLDAGSGSAEHFTIRAFDTNNNLITTPWLNDTAYVYSPSTTDGGGAPVATDMPGYNWNGTTANAYTFDGSTVSGNPNINALLTSAMDIRSIEITRDNNSNSFGFAAPLEAVPEPSMALFAGSFGALFFFRRHRTRMAA